MNGRSLVNKQDLIYLDNAATSRIKPDQVYDAWDFYTRQIGTSPGRGSHFLAIEASRCLYKARKTISQYFASPSTENIVFTKNATEAFNLFLNGYLNIGDHVLVSPFDHNAVFRPLNKLKDQGVIDYSILPIEVFQPGKEELFGEFIKENTKLFVMPLASNITGEIVFSSTISRYLNKKGVKILLDAAQGAGRIRLDMEEDKLDYIVFTGHKDLYGLPGTGGLCSRNYLNIEPLIQGGTGVHAETYINPDINPERYEAGTLNMPGIWSLKSGIKYIEENMERIKDKEEKLFVILKKGLEENSNIRIHKYNISEKSLPIISFTAKNYSCQEIAYKLNKEKICVRAGIHCNILGHASLGTKENGTIRVSLDCFNKEEEINKFLDVINKITKR